MEFETIIFRKEEGIGILQLNRPKQLNAISMQMRADIEKALEISIADKEIKVIILTGGTECFCSGADVREKDGIIQRLNDSKMYRILTRRKIIHSLIEECEIPVIAAIAGLAVGGGLELALACDIRIASDAARFGATEINFGTLPSGGGTQRLPRVIGTERAKEMIFTGNIINAQEALTIGLISRIVKREMLMTEVKALASKIAEKSPLAIKMAKFAVNKGVQMDLNSALDYEAQCVTVLHGTEDRKEALQAFAEKRKPVFKGR